MQLVDLKAFSHANRQKMHEEDEHPWLPEVNRMFLVQSLAAERAGRTDIQEHGFTAALGRPNVLAYAFVYFALNVGGDSLIFWMPQLAKSIFSGLSNLQIGFVSALPWVVAIAAMLVFVRQSDRSGERRWHLVSFALVCAVFLAAATQLASPVGAFALITVAIASYWCFMTTFWSVPMSNLRGSDAASGFALVNSCASVAGFIGPFVLGYLKARTGSFNHGIVLFSVCFVGAALVPLVCGTLFPPQWALSRDARR